MPHDADAHHTEPTAHAGGHRPETGAEQDPVPGGTNEIEAHRTTDPSVSERPPRPRRRSSTVVAALLAASALATSATLAYEAGQRSYRTPPGTVNIVEGAADRAGFARRLYDTSSEAVVRLHRNGAGTGTGFFYAPGKIVTNAHVIAGAAVDDGPVTVEVTLHDGRTREATVTALDARIDLAILTLPEPVDVPVLAFAEDTPSPGEPVAVLGHPFDEGLMVSAGIFSGVSANSRFAESDVQSLMLQIDAAVNPGNSGGPVLDASGAVVGVVTLRPDEADGRAVSGLALAIPATSVAAAITQLQDTGTVRYPVLGVLLRDTTPDDPVNDAAEVINLVPGSGAEDAGVQVGDRIVAVAGSPVTSASDVVQALTATLPGQRVDLTVLDPDGRRRTRLVTLGAR